MSHGGEGAGWRCCLWTPLLLLLLLPLSLCQALSITTCLVNGIHQSLTTHSPEELEKAALAAEAAAAEAKPEDK